MNIKFTLIFLFLSFYILSSASSGNDLLTNSANKTKGYIENKGQIIDQNNFLNSNVKFLWNGAGLNVQLRKTGFSYDVWQTVDKTLSLDAGQDIQLPSPSGKNPKAKDFIFHRIDFEFENANDNILIESENKFSDPINYYTTSSQENNLSEVNHYGKIIYKNVWDGIDIEFLLVNDKPKYNFIVHANAKLSDINIKINGADEITENGGTLIIKNSINNITETVPYSFITSNGIKEKVNIKFKKLSNNIYTFSSSEIIPTGSTLTIDPFPTLIWSTYYGGSNDEIPYGICSDASGNMTMTGITQSSGNIATSGASQTTYSGNWDIFIAKFNTSGQIIWSTYYGASGDDEAFGITSDRNNNNIILGYTSSTSGLGTSGALYQAAYGGGPCDAILAKFNSSGALQWATYFGGASSDYGYSVTNDSNNNILISGVTSSTTTIATSGAYQTSNAGSQDGFIAKFTSAGAKTWGTYYGGNQQDNFRGICMDTLGNIFAAGYTYSGSGIASGGSYKSTLGSSGDAFIVKLNSSGQRQWATYYGGSGTDIIWGIKCDKNGNLIFCGNTNSSTGIATTGAYQTSYGGNFDAFVGKISSSDSLFWCTYYGGVFQDAAIAVTTDNASNIYITGNTSSYSGMTYSLSTSQYYYGGGTDDGFLAKFDTLGVNLFSTYCGGNNTDLGKGIAYDGSTFVIIIGETNSTSGVATSGTYQTSLSGGYDAFLTKFSICPPASALVLTSNSPVCSGANLTLSSSGASSYNWTGPDGFTSNLQSPTISNATSINSGIYTLVANMGGCSISNQITPSILTASKPVPGFYQNYLNTCVNGNSFSFNDTSTLATGTLQRLWSFSNGDTSTSSSFNKTFTSSGIYTVKLFVTSGGNCRDSVIKTLNVFPSTLIGFTINDTVQCLAGNAFVLNDTSTYSSGTFTRVWNLGDGQITPNTSPLTKKYFSANTFHIKLITTNSNGCVDSVQKNVYVNMSPKVGYTQNSFGQCWASNQFSLSDTSTISSGSIVKRLWTWSNGDTSTSQNFLKSFSSSGVYQLTLSETSNLGCKDSVIKTFTIYPQNTTGFTVNSSNQCFTGNHYTFTDTSTSTGYTRLWRLGDGTTSDSAIVNKSYGAVGTYTIKLITTTTSSGCTDSAQRIISVNPFVQPLVGFTQNTFANCLSGNNFILNDTSTIPSGTISRLWKFSNGDTSTGNGISKSFLSSGSFTIKLVETSNNNCKDSISKTITIYPQTTIGFSANNYSQCFNGNNFLLNDTSTISSGNYTRLWSLGDGSNSNATSFNKSYLIDGTYVLKLVTTSNNGCKDSLQKIINVYPSPASGFTQTSLAQCLNGNIFQLQDTSKISLGTILLSFYKDGANIGNGSQGTNFGFTPLFTTPGVHIIKEVVHSNHGCYDSTTKAITIYPRTNAGFTINNTSQCFYGNNFFLNDTSSISSGSFSRLWTLGDNTTSSSSSLNKSYLNDGTYNIKLVTTSNNNCIDSTQKTVTVKAQPRAGFTQNYFVHCLSGNIFSLSDTSTITSGAYSVNWLFGNGDTSTSKILNKTFLTSGNFSAKLIATSTSGCNDSVTKTFTVYPQTAIGFSANNYSECFYGNNFVLIDTSTISNGSFTRLWSLGDTTTSSSIVINKNYLSVGTYQIKLATITNNGCRDSVQKTAIVLDQPKAGFSQNNFQECLSGNQFILNDTTFLSLGTYTRNWKFSDGDTSSFVTVNKTFASAGTYTTKLVAISQFGCADSVTKTFIIRPQYNVGFTIDNPNQCLQNNLFNLIDTTTPVSPVTRVWIFNGLGGGSGINVQHVFSSIGTFTIKLIRTSSFGCMDSSVQTVTVANQPKVGFAQNNLSECFNGNNFSLTDTSITSGIYTRLWHLGNGDTSTSTNPGKTFAISGTYTIKLVAFSSVGCGDSATKNFTVYPSTNIGFYQNNLKQCITNNNFLLFDTSTISSGTYTRLWTLGDGTTSANSFINKSYQTDGSYILKLKTITNNGCADSVQKNIQVNAQPKVGYTISNAIQCQSGNLFTLNDTSSISSGTINRFWSFSDSDTSTNIVVNKSFLNPGTYSSKLVVTSNNFCSDSVTKTLTILPKTNIGFSINTNTNQCLNGNNFIFEDTSFSLAGSYIRNWNFGDSTASSSIYISKKYVKPATFFVTLTTTTLNGCIDSLQKNITVYPQPIAGFTQNNLAQCLRGNNFLFYDTSTISNGTILRFWSFSDGDSSKLDSAYKSFLNDGIFQTKLIVTSNNNCTDSVSKTVTVYPQPQAGFIQNNLSQCFGFNFILTDTSKISSGKIARYWNFGDSTYDTASVTKKSYDSTGTYVVTLYTLTQNFCSDLIQKTVSVYVKPKAGFTQNTLAQCLAKNDFILNDTSIISSGNLTRLWSFSDSATSTQKSLNKSFASSGTYQIKLIAISDSNCTDTAIKYFTIYNKPSAGFTVNNLKQCFNTNNFLLTDTSKNISSGYKLFWNFGDSTTDTISPTQKTFNDIGYYNISLKIIDNNSCSDSINKTVTVLVSPAKPVITQNSRTQLQSTKAEFYSWYLNNAMYQDSGSEILNVNLNGSYKVKIINSFGCSNISDSVNILNVDYNASNGNIFIYPNPASDNFLIDFNGLQGEKNIQIIDLAGQIILEFTGSDVQYSVITSDFTRGMYLVRITTNAGVFVKKVLID